MIRQSRGKNTKKTNKRKAQEEEETDYCTNSNHSNDIYG